MNYSQLTMRACGLHRVLWKERCATRRIFRLVWGYATAADVFLCLIARGGASDFRFSAASSLAACFAICCGAGLFAKEREEGTVDFLLGMPATRAELIVGKLLFGVMASLAMAGLLALQAWLFAGGQLPSKALAGACLLSLQALGWGIFCSLATRDALNAIGWAVVGVFAVSLIAGGGPLTSPEPARLILLLAVWGVDLWLAWRWTGPRRALHGSKHMPGCTSGPAVDRTQPCRSVFPTSRMPRSRWMRSMGRLAWHAWRSARLLAAWSAAAGLVLLFIAAPLQTFIGFDYSMLVVTAVVLLMGVWSSQNVDGGRRFLVQRGIGPFSHCLAVHAVWLVTAALFTAIGVLASWQGNRLWLHLAEGSTQDLLVARIAGWIATDVSLRIEKWTGMPLEGSGRVLAFFASTLLGVYGAGQLASALAKRTVVAVCLGIGGGAFLVAWSAGTFAFRVPLGVSLAPPIAAMLLTTYLRWRDWTPQGDSLLRSLRCGIVLAAGFGTAVGLTAAWRVWEVPAGAQGTVQAGRPNAGEDAAARPAALSETPAHPPFAPTDRQKGAIETLLSAACEREARGELDEALATYLSALRLANSSGQSAGIDEWAAATLASQHVVRQMPQWAARPGQSPARIRDAIRRLAEIHAQTAPPRNAIKFEHRLIVEKLNGFCPQETEPTAVWWRRLAACCSFERTRATRVLDAITREQLGSLEEVERRLAQGTSVAELTSHWNSARRRGIPSTAAWQWYATTPLLWNRVGPDHEWQARMITDREAAVRAATILMALVGWRLEHGDLPDSLDRVTGRFLDEVPCDPWSGSAFCYRANGFAHAIVFRGRTFQPHEPVLWSVGELGTLIDAKGCPPPRAIAFGIP